MKPTSKESLKRLNGKEIELKEKIFKIITTTKATNKEVVRVLAYWINMFKKL